METVKMSEREVRCAELAYKAAAQGMVLLENNGALPIAKSGKTALFGMGAVRTVRGGTGSGDPFNGGLSGGGKVDVDQSPRYHIHILDAFEMAGYDVVTADTLRAQAVSYDEAKSKVRPGMTTFLFPEPKIGEDVMTAAAAESDTAIYVITRNSGEGADRHMYGPAADGDEQAIGDYLLSVSEKENLKALRAAFKKLIVVLNVGGILDTKDIRGVKPDAVLLMSLAGQEGGRAVRDVLNGTFDPSGKLTDTWAENYEDYPASASFGSDNRNIDLEEYKEGIFVGYKYFDLKGTKPAYPFGYGLSYTSFETAQIAAALNERTVSVTAAITNTGSCAGAEVFQVYARICPSDASEAGKDMTIAVKSLAGYKKTKELQPGETEVVKVEFCIDDLAAFVEKDQAYTLLAGDYVVLAGTSSDDLAGVAKVQVVKDQVISLVNAVLPVEKDFEEPVHRNELSDEEAVLETLVLEKEAVTVDLRMKDDIVPTYVMDDYEAILSYDKQVKVEKRKITYDQVLNGEEPLEDFIAQLTDEQLANINTGTGWGVADENNPIIGENSESVPGAAGETTRTLMEEYGVPAIVMADGPGGVRVRQEFEATNEITGEKEMVCHYTTAWPVGTLLAQSFDDGLQELVGAAFAEEMKAIGVAILLAPGMNIHRDPLCGRNFEYYSEDPLVTGKNGAAFVNGLQNGTGVGGCIKHFAANNQETNRHSVDEIISQRALREVYLRGFEIAVRESDPWCIMTAYNKINHVACGDSRDLCNVIARKEWGFNGLIMTDWNGGSSVASKSMHAGNDLIMPGGPSKQKEILLAYNHIDPLFDERGGIALTKPVEFMPFYEDNWNSFRVDPNGKDTVTAELGEGHTAEVKDGQILVDGEPVYLEATDKYEFLRRRGEAVNPFCRPATTETAEVSKDGKKITYRGTWDDIHTITRGDLQNCAMNILKIVMRVKL